MTEMTMIEALNSALMQEMQKDKSIVVLGEDVAKNGGVFRTTDNLHKKFGERVFDTPLAELGIIGTSIGMAIYGLKPVAEIQFSGFAYGAFDELICHASRIRTRSRGRLTCPMVLRTPYCGGIRALEHHSESMEAIYAHTPGLKMVIPSTPYEAKGLLIASIRDPDPVIFFEPKRLYRAIKEQVPQKDYEIELGKANVVKEGSDLTLISWGAMLKVTKEAAEMVDLDCEIIDLRTMSPLDTETIIQSVSKTGRCIIVQEAPKSGGMASEIIARINEKALDKLEAPIERVAGFDTIFPLYQLENHYLPNAKRIIKAMQKVMSY